jgi:uncharacterized protein YbjT (DUF2867 family)
MVLVVGATGLGGSELCKRLMARGERVKALVRATSSHEKVAALRSLGVELCLGDLKDPQSINAGCRDVDAVISTASSTLSRQPADSIETVDADGQLALVETAKDAGVARFVFVSFPRMAGISFPLGEAKERVETAIKPLNFTVVQASYFMEVWLSPALGFDYENATARIYGSGTEPISWVSFRDVAEFCAIALRHPSAERRVIEFGGPEPLSPHQVADRFERIGGKPFRLEHVSEQAILAQFESAADSLSKSFAALLGYLRGNSVDMSAVVDTFGIQLTSVDEYARSVLTRSAAPPVSEHSRP